MDVSRPRLRDSGTKPDPGQGPTLPGRGYDEPDRLQDRAMIAIREAWKAGLLGRAHWGRNLVSGVIVAVVALPLALSLIHI